MRSKIKIAVFASLCILLGSASIYAETYKAAVMQLPPGVSEMFIKVISEVVEGTGNKVEIQVVPPARTTVMVVNKEVDFSLPMLTLTDPAKVRALNYDYSEAVLYKVSFVLFTNKSKPISIEELRNGNPNGYKIDVDISQVDSWDFKGIPSSNVEASLRRVAEGKIDGCLYSQTSADPILKSSANIQATKIHRELYAVLDSTFPLLKGTRGGKVDQMLQEGLAILKKSGNFDEVFPLQQLDTYVEWQP